MEKFNFWKKLSILLALMLTIGYSSQSQVISSFPFSEDFEQPLPPEISLFDTTESNAERSTDAGYNSSYGLLLEGAGLSAWTGGSGSTTETEAWVDNAEHHAKATINADFSSLTAPKLKFYLEQGYDFGSKYTWFRVVVNGDSIADINGDINHNPASSGLPFSLLTYDLSSYAGQSNVTIELQSSCKYDNPDNYNYIDDLEIYEPEPNDMAVNDWVAPKDGALSSSEQVEIEVVNKGTQDQTDPTVSYSIDGGNNWTTETMSQTISGGDTANYTFSATADMDTVGSYNCIAAVNVAGDTVNTGNDTLTTTIESLPLYSMPFSDGFEGTLDKWTFSGSANPNTTTSEAYEGSKSLELVSGPGEDASARINFAASSGDPILSFAYMVDYYNYNEFSVEIQESGSSTWKKIHEFTGGISDDDIWIYKELTLDTLNTTSGPFSIRMNAKNTHSYSREVWVDDFEIFVPQPDDMAVLDWIEPTDRLLSPNEQVEIQIANVGTQDQTDPTVSYSIDGGNNWTTETMSQTVSSGDTLNYTFSATADMDTTGVYNCLAAVNVPGDTVNTDDDTLSTTVESQPAFALPFTEDFESFSSSEWYFTPQSGYSWELGNGSTGSSSTGPNGDHTTGNGNYLAIEASGSSTGDIAYLYSPNIDTNSLPANPVIKFYYHMYGSDMGDLYVQEFANGTWTSVDSIKGEQQTAESDPWLLKSVNLSSNVTRVRFKAISGGSYKGDMAIDDIAIPLGNDLKLSKVVEPFSGIDLQSNTNVTVEIQNIGTDPQSNFDVKYSLDSGSTYTTETISSTLQPDSTTTYTFSSTADMSTSGIYNTEFIVDNTGDANRDNDTIAMELENFAIPYTQNFDSVTEPALPKGWSYIAEDGDQYVETNDYEVVSAPNALRIDNDGADGGQALMAIMPPYYGNISDKWITMNIYSETTDDSVIVGVLDNPQDATTFTDVDTITFANNDTWYAKYVELSSYSGTGKYIAFRHTSTDTYADMFIDDLTLETIPTGPVFAFDTDTLDMGKVQYNYPDTTIKTVTITNNGLGGMDVTNTAISGTNSSNFDVVDTNTYPKTLNTFESLSLQVEFFGSTEEAKTASLDVTDDSTTHNLPIVGEVVDAAIDTFPFVETMDHMGNPPLGWKILDTLSFEWEIGQSTGSSGTGPSEDHTTGTGYFAFTEATGASEDDSAMVITPLTDFTTLTSPKMNFWYHMHGEDMGKLYIDVAVGGNWISAIDSIIGEQHPNQDDAWMMKTVDLGSYASADSIRFTGVRGSGYKSDISIDDVAFGEDLDIDLGPDTVTICDGKTATLDAGYDADWTYEWYVDTMDVVASTSQDITVDSAAKYYVKVTGIGGFSGIDSVIVNVDPSPNVDITTTNGPVYCESASIDTLVGSPSGGSYSGNGVSGNTFDPSAAGTGEHVIQYSYTNSYGCSNTDSIIVKVNPLPVVDAGADEEICKGDSVTLKATYNNLFFSEYIEGSSNNKAIEFYNGTGKTINLDNFAVLTNYNGGSWSGEYTFPSGTTLNDGETYVVANSSADQTILDEADETLSFNEKGYIVGFNGNDVRALVQYTPNGDTVILDQIGRYDMVDPGNGWDVAGVTDGTEDHTLIRKPNAGPNLGDWDASAGTDSISSEWYVMPQDDFSDLGTHTTNLSNKAYASVSYLWSNGATTESITVAPSTDQTYTVTLTDAMGCTNVDTVDVTVNDLPDVDLGADSMFVCAADTATLYAGDFDAYNWSTGETTDSIMVDSSGIGLNSEMITVSVTDSLGCMNTDTIMLTFVDYPSVNIAGPDTFKYYTETATYDAGSGFASYLWSTGATTQDITIDSSDVNLGTNTISVTVSNDYGCETTEDKDIYADDDSGTEDINDDMQISVYPNPNAGIFTLEINGPKEDFNLEIMNVKGQLIQSEQINANEFSKQYDFSNLSGGIYYIRLINEDMTKTQKLIIR